MSEYNCSSISSFNRTWQNNEQYFNMLSLMASLSRLFSDSEIPYLDYRLAENLFCKYYNAINDARLCTAYDARIFSAGVGIKTFILKNNESVEKIAEFNKLRPQLKDLHGKELACKLGIFRNDRMRFSNDCYDLTDSQYHIIGRDKGLLRIFNTPYEFVDVNNIKGIKETEASIKFEDGLNEYTFNKSKSVLLKRFAVPRKKRDVLVDLIEDTFPIIEKLLTEYNIKNTSELKQRGVDYVVLPLYSIRTNTVPEKSGLNQWNAGGRKRGENELYIPVPTYIHHNFPTFFPERDCPFVLYLPNGVALSAKICQDNGKALMSNPNSALGEWLLRKVLRKTPGVVVTKQDLDIFGISSVIVTKLKKQTRYNMAEYAISFFGDHEEYIDFSS